MDVLLRILQSGKTLAQTVSVAHSRKGTNPVLDITGTTNKPSVYIYT